MRSSGTYAYQPIGEEVDRKPRIFRIVAVCSIFVAVVFLVFRNSLTVELSPKLAQLKATVGDYWEVF